MQTFDLNPPEIVRAARFMTMRPDDSLFCDGAMLVDNGLVFVIGSFHDLKKTYPDLPVNDLGDVTLVPGLLNAHCHLEMSHLLGRVEPGLGFDGWIKNIGRASLYELDRSDVELAIKQMRDSGTCFVGDISTRNVETIAGILEDSGFFFICFAEHIFFSPPEPDQEFVPDGFFDMGAYSAAGHALHTTNAATLQAIKAQTMELGLPFSIHLAEHDDESTMLMGEKNALTELLQEANIPLTNFRPPMTRPVSYARALGLLDEATLAVHCVTVNDEDIRALHESGATVCLCPRSNEFIGVGRAPWEKLVSAGIPCCLGTDGLGSNADLNLWNEVRFIKERWQGELSLDQAVAMLTRNPAAALGVIGLGELAPGKEARFATVPKDVEELFSNG